MPMKAHRYTAAVHWTGNTGTGTAHYAGYSRAHEVRGTGKPTIPCSSDPAFRGDPACYNPEELLVASLAGCHMLWFLHQCAMAGVVVETYEDAPEGTMVETEGGGGHFTAVVLRPLATFRETPDPSLVHALHERSHALCYIANSVNFPVSVVPRLA
jgi:organic hydroperoxide reductase OsmC/OhrA